MQGVCSEKPNPDPIRTALGTFQIKHLESEMLPPTVGTLIPHIQRVNYMVTRDKGYTSPHPSLPNIEGNGWSEKWLPMKCIVPPAPRAVVELVNCGCKGECKGDCYCANNGLPAHLFANAMQLVAATIRTITGMIKTRT